MSARTTTRTFRWTPPSDLVQVAVQVGPLSSWCPGWFSTLVTFRRSARHPNPRAARRAARKDRRASWSGCARRHDDFERALHAMNTTLMIVIEKDGKRFDTFSRGGPPLPITLWAENGHLQDFLGGGRGIVLFEVTAPADAWHFFRSQADPYRDQGLFLSLLMQTTTGRQQLHRERIDGWPKAKRPERRAA